MKVRIDVNELFPVYVQTTDEDFGLEVDVPEELLNELKASHDRFSAAQEAVRELYEKAYKAKHGMEW